MDGDGGQGGQGQVDPEDRVPFPQLHPRHHRARDQRHQPAVQGPERAAQLLGRSHRPEGHRPFPFLPQVADERHRDRQQRAPGHPLDGPPGHHHDLAGRQRRQDGAEREGRQAGVDQRPPPVAVGQLPEQRHRGHVPEQEARDDRGRALQVVERDADVLGDVDEDGHHHVRVERGQQHHRAPRAEHDPAGAPHFAGLISRGAV